MNTYIVRPYFGHDCDSSSGFNNGHYLPEIEVTAENEPAAAEIAMAQIKNEFNAYVWTTDSYMGEFCFYREFNHSWCDSDDNEVGEDTDGAECHYQYEYIDFTDVMEVDGEA